MLAPRRGLAFGTFLLTQLLPSTYKCQSTDEQTKQITSPTLLRQSTAEFVCDDNKSLVTNPCMCGFLKDREEIDVADALVTGSAVSCINGFSNTGSTSYPCNNIDLMSHIPLSTLNSASGSSTEQANDCWGWTDNTNNREYAIIGLQSGTSFVDITDPINPIYVGKLPSRGSSVWGDIKTYMNHAFIVKESNEGLQIIDLSQLGSVSPGSILSETAHYSGFTNAHNIAINEESGFAYAVGTSTCGKGLHMIDIRNPSNPTFSGCYSDDGYTHDVQCVIYKGSHSEYVGKEICFAENEDTVTIIDVTDKSNPSLLSRTSYTNVFYTHQGWLTEDHNYLIFGDEIDEMSAGLKTTTYVLNVMSLVNPALAGTHTALTDAIDHNQYVKGNFVYQANYRAGLRILEMNDMSSANFNEIAYFDIYPGSDSANFNGAWSTYPYFDSGSIIVSGIEQGLFVLRGTWMTSSPLLSYTPSSKPTINPSSSNSPSLKSTALPSIDPSNIPSFFLSHSPSTAPSISYIPSSKPTVVPSSSNLPSLGPTMIPSSSTLPSSKPTMHPSSSNLPSSRPTLVPSSSNLPSLKPTIIPSSSTLPSSKPTINPTSSNSPSIDPTALPSIHPSNIPSFVPSDSPSTVPSISYIPSSKPTVVPSSSNLPSLAPTKNLTEMPTKELTRYPTKMPTKALTRYPTKIPTKASTAAPTKTPTKRPTNIPTKSPSKSPTTAPTKHPTNMPTKSPTTAPTKHSTNVPTKYPTTTPTRAPTPNPTVLSTNDVRNTLTIPFDNNARIKKVNGNLFYIKSKINMSINEILSYVQNKKSASTSSTVMVYTMTGKSKSLNENKYKMIKSTIVNGNRRKQQISFGKFNCPVNINKNKSQAFLIRTTGSFFAFKGDIRSVIGENNDMEVINVASMVKKRNTKAKILKRKQIKKKKNKIKNKKLMWTGSLLYARSRLNTNCS